MKLGACVTALRDAKTITACVRPLVAECDRVVVVTAEDRTYDGTYVGSDGTAELAERAGAELIVKSFLTLHEQRQFGVDMLGACDMVLTLDADEVFTRVQLEGVRALFDNEPEVASWVARMPTYWHKPCYRLDPVASHAAPIALDPRRAYCDGERLSGTRLIRNKPGFELAVRGELPFHLCPRHYSWIGDADETKAKLAVHLEADAILGGVDKWLEHYCAWQSSQKARWPWSGNEFDVVEEEVPAEIAEVL